MGLGFKGRGVGGLCVGNGRRWGSPFAGKMESQAVSGPRPNKTQKLKGGGGGGFFSLPFFFFFTVAWYS